MRVADQRPPRTLSDGQKTVIAFTATWVAGYVDASGYILLSHIYTSNMTGNTIDTAMRATSLNWAGAIQRAWPILMFVAGLVFSAIMTEAALRRGILSFSSLSLALEAALIAIFVALSAPVFTNAELHPPSFWSFNGLVALLAVAMGLQNQTISRIGALSFRTTHVTGNLTRMSADFSEYLFWLFDQIRGRPLRVTFEALRRSTRQREFRLFSIGLGLWLFFTMGAICAIVAIRRWGLLCLLAPACVLTVLVAVDLVSPIAASAEQAEIQKQ